MAWPTKTATRITMPVMSLPLPQSLGFFEPQPQQASGASGTEMMKDTPMLGHELVPTMTSIFGDTDQTSKRRQEIYHCTDCDFGATHLKTVDK
ncbi:hypothetical protein GJAV_G00086980 [Gymnothorax javanicus]|nr:hypothetical protein GJAV_G00086980 [Gymnothorax javanicus]